MAPISKTQRGRNDVGYSNALGGREAEANDATVANRRLRLRWRKRSLDVNVPLQVVSTELKPSASPRSPRSPKSPRSDTEAQSGDAPKGLLKRDISDILDKDGDDDNQGLTLPQSVPHPLPLPSLPPNPLAAILPGPNGDVSSPPPPPPPAAPPAQPPLLPSISIPPPASATDGISENDGSHTPTTKRPSRVTLSAALPKYTSSGGDSDSDDDGSDDDDDHDRTRFPSSMATRSILSLTPAISPYDPQTTNRAGEAPRISRTRDTTSSLTTSVFLPHQTASTMMTTMTNSPIPSRTAPVALEQEAARTSRLSPAGEKGVIASASICGFAILLALAWFLWRSSKRKSAGGGGSRKRAWPASFPSREIFEGPRRISSRVGDKFTSIRGRLLPGTVGWCNIDDPSSDNVAESEKPAPMAAAAAPAKTGGLFERRTGTPPQRVTVNSYGMIFRTPMNDDDSVSDILEPANRTTTTTPPPSSMGAKAKHPVFSSKQMAAAHLENARASVRVSVSAHNTTTTTTTTTTLPALSPLRMNTIRISDVSSLSSGFGDGDIVIIQSPTAAVAVKPTQPHVVNSHINLEIVRNSPERSPERKSFSSRFSRNRDTVLTNASEDLRPRFRTVSSWVRQQSRRTKKAAASSGGDGDEGGVPAVPDMVPEQGFDMMMPDGEEPRRVESAMWKGK